VATSLSTVLERDLDLDNDEEEATAGAALLHIVDAEETQEVPVECTKSEAREEVPEEVLAEVQEEIVAAPEVLADTVVALEDLKTGTHVVPRDLRVEVPVDTLVLDLSTEDA